MDRIYKFIKNNKVNCILIILYGIIVSITMFHHEIWRDEAQVWCIVRDMNISDIFTTSRIEGHPILWYMILFPFAKLGFDVFTMQIISFLFVFAAIVYFVLKSPCNNILKTFVVLSSGLMYYLPIISRNYALVPIFLFLSANLHQKRKEYPLLYGISIILLANTHILMFGICLILAFLFCIETIKDKPNKKSIIATILMVINFVFLFGCFWGMQNINHATAFYAQNPKDIGVALTYFAQIFYLFPFSMLPDWINAGTFYILILLTLLFYFKNDKKIFIILTASLCFHWLIYYKVWYIGIVYQKSFLLLLIILFCYWIYNSSTKNKSKILTCITAIFFAVSAIPTYFNIMFEITHQYSGAKQVANYIKTNLNSEKEFIVWGYPFCFSAISAYLPDKKLYMIDREYYITYYSFDLDKKSQKQPMPKSKYYITVANYTIGHNYEKVFQSDTNIINLTEYNEIFSIYKKSE